MIKLPRITTPLKVIVLALLCIFFMCLVILHFITWVTIESMDEIPMEPTDNEITDDTVVRNAILGDASNVTIDRIDDNGVPVIISQSNPNQNNLTKMKVKL